jgi:hypothetical protein
LRGSFQDDNIGENGLQKAEYRIKKNNITIKKCAYDEINNSVVASYLGMTLSRRQKSRLQVP